MWQELALAKELEVLALAKELVELALAKELDLESPEDLEAALESVEVNTSLQEAVQYA